MSDSSRARLLRRTAAEGTFAETPGSNPATTLMRFLRESINVRNATVASEEIRADRQRSDLALVGQDAAGDVVQEVSFRGDIDTWLEAALCGTWAPTSAASVADGATTSGSPTVTSASAAFAAGDVGSPISGAGIPASSYIGVRNSATSIGLSSSPVANTPVNATATATGVTLTMGRRAAALTNGTTNRSFNLEKGFMDISRFIELRGAAVNRWALDLTARRIATMTTSFMAARALTASSSLAGSTTPTNPNVNQVIRAGDLISLTSAGTSNVELTGYSARRITLDINNNLRAHELVTQFATDDYGRGVMDITGTLETFFKDNVAYAAFLANQFFALRFTIKDPALGIGYQFTLPNVKVTDAPVETPGVDSDVMQPISWRALVDPAVGYSIHVLRGA